MRLEKMDWNRIALAVAIAELLAAALFAGWRKAMANPPNALSGQLGVVYDEACNAGHIVVNGQSYSFAAGSLDLGSPDTSTIGPVIMGPAEIPAGTVQIVGNGSSAVPVVERGAWTTLKVDCIAHAHML